jgi:polygalacturonase
VELERRSFLIRSVPLALADGSTVPARVASERRATGDRRTVFNILEYGAEGDGRTLETRAILKAIK